MLLMIGRIVDGVRNWFDERARARQRERLLELARRAGTDTVVEEHTGKTIPVVAKDKGELGNDPRGEEWVF